MPDLNEQVAQPLIEYIPPKLRGTSQGSRYKCPSCGLAKALYSPLCRSCSTASLRSPVDEQIYVVGGEECRRIPLNDNRYAIVDVALYDFLMQWRWRCYTYRADVPLYVVTKAKSGINENFRGVKMHHIILGIPSSQHVDHINRDELDNRRSNFRLSDPWIDACNRGKRRDNTIGFTGVRKNGNRYAALIGYKGRRIWIGSFSTAEEAAIARDVEARRLHGEYASLNFTA